MLKELCRIALWSSYEVLGGNRMLVIEFYKYMWKNEPVWACILTMLISTCVFVGVICMYAIGVELGVLTRT